MVILAQSQSITYLGVCFNSVEMCARLSQECSVTILSSLRHFRLGNSVHLKEFQRLLVLMAAASAVCLLHMPTAVMAEISSPLVWTFGVGCLHIAVSPSCIEALTLWHNPDLFSWRVPLGLVMSRVVVMMDALTHGLGSSVPCQPRGCGQNARASGT